MKTIMFLLFALISGKAITQEVVIQSFETLNNKRAIECELIQVINQKYVKIIFHSEHDSYNKGYIRLNNTNEIDSFINDMNEVIIKYKSNNLFEIVKPQYKICSKPKQYQPNKGSYQLYLYETIKTDSDTFIILTSNSAEEILNWLKLTKEQVN